MATLASDRESAAVARAELQAMAAGPIDANGGLSPVGDAGTARALTVMQAEAEGTRATAEAQVLRAGYLPGLSLGGDMSNGGLGLTVGAANGLGIGQGSAIEAAMAQAAAVEARITTEEETVARETAALQGRLDSLVRQEAEAQRIAAQAQANFDLFAEQQQSGQRSVPETMNVLQTLIEARRTAAGLQYDIVAARVAIAARLGVLVDGERM
jgi:adhesin transport system outer membrane protein